MRTTIILLLLLFSILFFPDLFIMGILFGFLLYMILFKEKNRR